MRKVIYTFFALLTVHLGFSQGYYLGMNSPKVQWKQIDTDKVQVVFMEGNERQAQRAANIVHYLYDSSFYSLGSKKDKVPIILQSNTNISNGFVTVGPFHSQFFMTSPQYNFSGVGDWADLLAIHEYRHVEQFVNAKRGATRVGRFLFGEYGWGGFAGLSLPRWFFEGDAVYYETALTPAGRGRNPAFQNEYRAVLLEKKVFNYEKASATSMREFIPNHYTLGYHLTNEMRKSFGHGVVRGIHNEATNYDRVLLPFNGLLYPFSKSVKHVSGKKIPKYYKGTFEQLRKKWQAEEDSLGYEVYDKVSIKKKRTFTSYNNPTFHNQDKLLFVKSGYDEIPSIYQLDLITGKEELIRRPGIFSEENATLSTDGSRFIWSELRFDQRWSEQDYMEVKAHSIVNNDRQDLTSGTRYFSPAFSPSGVFIATVEVNQNGSNEIHILDSYGQIQKQLRFSTQDSYSFPIWENEENLIVIVKAMNRNWFARISLESETIEQISPAFERQIGYPQVAGDFILFTGNFSTKENIYAFQKANQKIFQITDSRFGARQSNLSPDGKTLVFSEFTANGYNLSKTDYDPASWKEVQDLGIPWYDIEETARPEYRVPDIFDTKYETSEFKYNKGLLNIHSWTPFYNPPLGGVTVYADNIMSTLSASGQILYNDNEGTVQFTGEAEYGAFFPAISTGYTFGDRSRSVAVIEPVTDTTARPNIDIQLWEEKDFNLGVTIPLNLSKGNFITQLNLTNRYHRLWIDYKNDDLGTDENFGTWEFETDLSTFQRRALRYVNPRYGLTSQFRYQTTLGTDLNKSSSTLILSQLYLPGLMRTHSTFFIFGFQNEPFLAQFKFRDQFFYARGYAVPLYDRINRFGINYRFPLLYPDIPLGPFMFIKRIKATAFYDIMNYERDASNASEWTNLTDDRISGPISGDSNSLSSVGAEVTMDFRFLRTLDIDAGFRFSRLLDEQPGIEKNSFQALLLSITF